MPWMADMPADLRCPRCGDLSHVQKVSAIYYGGISVSHLQGSSTTVGYHFGEVAPPGYAETQHSATLTHQTAMSKRLEPPYVLSPLVGLVLRTLGDPVASLLGHRSHFAAVIQEQRFALYYWNQLYYCFRCDGVFIPTEQAAALWPATELRQRLRAQAHGAVLQQIAAADFRNDTPPAQRPGSEAAASGQRSAQDLSKDGRDQKRDSDRDIGRDGTSRTGEPSTTSISTNGSRRFSGEASAVVAQRRGTPTSSQISDGRSYRRLRRAVVVTLLAWAVALIAAFAVKAVASRESGSQSASTASPTAVDIAALHARVRATVTADVATCTPSDAGSAYQTLSGYWQDWLRLETGNAGEYAIDLAGVRLIEYNPPQCAFLARALIWTDMSEPVTPTEVNEVEAILDELHQESQAGAPTAGSAPSTRTAPAPAPTVNTSSSGGISTLLRSPVDGQCPAGFDIKAVGFLAYSPDAAGYSAVVPEACYWSMTAAVFAGLRDARYASAPATPPPLQATPAPASSAGSPAMRVATVNDCLLVRSA